MKDIRVGSPSISEKGYANVGWQIMEGRISEGKVAREFEEKFAEFVGAKEAIVVNSGNSALFLSLLAARELHGVTRAVTTSLTFAATVSAALNAGLSVECCDVREDLLIDTAHAKNLIDKNPRNCVYLPVHLFGYPVPRFSHKAFEVQDACEALGTRDGGKPVGLPHLGCFSFYTSHVAGCGEMGVVVASDAKDAEFIRSMKDQGRTVARSPSHVEKMTPTPFGQRYAHARVGWNFRTTDVQVALALDGFHRLSEILSNRQQVFRDIHHTILDCHPRVRALEPKVGVSHLAFPMVCETTQLRDHLVKRLEENRIETRPLLSVIPNEQAFRSKVKCPMRHDVASLLHRKGFYVSCHESLTTFDVCRISQTIRKALEERIPRK